MYALRQVKHGYEVFHITTGAALASTHDMLDALWFVRICNREARALVAG